MTRLGRGLVPPDLAIATGADLEAGDNELQVPEVGVLLPQHETSDLGVSPRPHAAVSLAHFRPDHLNLPYRIHAVHCIQHALAARGRHVLLDYVLCRRSFLVN